MKKPSQSSPSDIPGAKSRWDDFLGTHIIRADDVHFTVRPKHRRAPHLFHF